MIGIDLYQTRLALAGRSLRMREVAFEALGEEPRLRGVSLRAYGPYPVADLPSLAAEASRITDATGYPPDAFLIVGWPPGKLVALVPSEPPVGVLDQERLLEALGYN